MNITVVRQIKFCAGHRLLGHEGKCANLHGHNYVAQFYVTGSETDELGRVVDFSVINKLFKGWIDEHWDHGVLLWDEDQEAVKAVSMMETNRLFCMPYNPTAENMAKYLLCEVAPSLVKQIQGYDVTVTKVVIWETENSAAMVSLANDGSGDLSIESLASGQSL